MQFRQFGRVEEKVSALGFGAMRLPVRDGAIDEAEAIRLIRHAIDNGVNYVDTAYIYHDGCSESLVGKALRDGYREKSYVATKSPLWLLKKPEDFDRCLDEQLERLQTDVIDFYLLHAVDRNGWFDIVQKMHLIERAEKAKAQGKIRHIGFSFHDTYEVFRTIVDSYDGWDFCQIQLNYVDVDHQAEIRGLEYAAARGLGVVIMEPLLGGKLASPPDSVRRLLPEERTPVEWALDFLWNRPEVSVVLSGMSAMEQVEDNLAYASRAGAGMLKGCDDMFRHAKAAYETMARVPCTGCAYCMPCPFGVEIPKVFEAYNRTAHDEKAATALYEGLQGKAALCQSCAKCVHVCPQHIDIPQRMDEINAHFGKTGEENA